MLCIDTEKKYTQSKGEVVAGVQQGSSTVLVITTNRRLVGDSLCPQLSEQVVQVEGVRVTMARAVGPKLGLVVDLIPRDCVLLPRGGGLTDGEDQPPVPSIH